MTPLFSHYSATLAELKHNPSALLNEAEGAAIAIMDRNRPTAYLVPAETYAWLMEQLEDGECGEIIRQRAHEKSEAIEINLDDL